MLYTNLKHIENALAHTSIIHENEHVMVICGNMGPMCIPLYRVAEELESDYPHIKFFDMEFDNPESLVVRNLPEVAAFRGIPFTIFYNKGQVVRATSGTQTKSQITAILDSELAATINI
jgi:thioredoxin 1